jgi:hypothetical protein
MTPARVLAFVLSLVAGAALAACVSVARQDALDSKEARWSSIEVQAPSDRVVWQLTLLALQGQGYPLTAGADPGSRAIESGWKTDLQPFRGEGQRRRALVRLAAIEKGLWKLEARVKVEENKNLVTPLDATRAQWKAAPDDELSARTLLQHVRARLHADDLPSAPRTD